MEKIWRGVVWFMEPAMPFLKMMAWVLAPLALIFVAGSLFIFPFVAVPLVAAGVAGALYWRARRRA